MKKSSNHTAGWGWDGADTAHIMALKVICTEVSGENMWFSNGGHGCSRQ